MVISTQEMMKRTGASNRQMNHWATHSLIVPIGESNPGSGYPREWDEDLVGRIALLVVMSKAFNHGIDIPTLKKIYAAYEEGHVYLEGDIKLCWRW